MSIRVMMTFGLTGFRLPSIQRSLDRLISGQSLNPFLIFCNFEEAMGPSLLSLRYPSPEFLGVSFSFCLRFQSHNFGESYLLTFLGYIYTGHGYRSNNNPLRLKSLESLSTTPASP